MKVLSLFNSIRRFHISIKQEFMEWLNTLDIEELQCIQTVNVTEVHDLPPTGTQDNTNMTENQSTTIPITHVRERLRIQSGDVIEEGATHAEDCSNGDENCEEIVRETIAQYLKTVTSKTAGKDVMYILKHIMSSYGFPVVVRNSKYAKEATLRHTFKKFDFRCIKRDKCAFRMVFRGCTSGNDGSHSDPHRTYELGISGWHDRSPKFTRLHTSLPQHLWDEVTFMKNSALIPTRKMIRYLEEKYSILLHTKNDSRRLRYHMKKLYPQEDDCHRLVSYLVKSRPDTTRTNNERCLLGRSSVVARFPLIQCCSRGLDRCQGNRD